MSILVKQLKNNRKVIFDKGNFDNWCVYIVEPNGQRNAPFDSTYFIDIQNLARLYPKHKIYSDFVSIYQSTTKNVDERVIQLIDKIIDTYQNEHQSVIEQWFAVIYGGMIAEENKEFAILKKRIKRLGMYQVLVLEVEPTIAANYSKGKKWTEHDALMMQYGF